MLQYSFQLEDIKQDYWKITSYCKVKQYILVQEQCKSVCSYVPSEMCPWHDKALRGYISRVLIWEQMPAENIHDYKEMTKFHRAPSELPQKDDLC